MTALFSKELWQGRPLLIFGAALALLLSALSFLVNSTALFGSGSREPWRTLTDWAAIWVPIALAFLAGAGLFAAETDRGTLPALFALPLSRGRIWGAKTLAALALTVSASLLFIGLSLALMPSASARLPLLAFLPDLGAWLLVAFAAALFCSTLAGGSTTALLASLMLAGAVAAGASWLVFTQGAPLLWYAEALDVALWSALAVAPALLVASLVTLRYGELLHSARKWLLAFATLFAVLLITTALVSGVARVATRYQRAAVVTASTFIFDRTPRPLSLLAVDTTASPITLQRDDTRGWVKASGQPTDHPAVLGAEATFRANYLVVLDPTTGRELLHLRRPARTADFHAAVSPDATRLAVVTRPLGLTWGTRWQATPVVEVYALPQGRLLRRTSLPTRNDHVSTVDWISWSSAGRYFAIEITYETGGGHVLLFGSDGALRQDVVAALLPAVWTNEGAFYGFARDTLYRITPDSSEAKYVWSTGPSRNWRIYNTFGASPDGTWLAFAGSSEPHDETQPGDRNTALWALNLRTQEVKVLLHEPSDRQHVIMAAWPGRGQTLAVVLWDTTARRARRYHWRPGDAALTPMGAEITGLLRSLQVLSRPDTDDLVLWTRELPAGNWPDIASRVEVLIVDAQGRVRHVPADAVARDGFPAGFDTAGRLLFTDSASGHPEATTLRALDLPTGQTSRVYP